jgi:hypothetical protein
MYLEPEPLPGLDARIAFHDHSDRPAGFGWRSVERNSRIEFGIMGHRH